MQGFELVRGKDSRSGVSAAGVVPIFDPFQDCDDRFRPGVPVPPVEELELRHGLEWLNSLATLDATQTGRPSGPAARRRWPKT